MNNFAGTVSESIKQLGYAFLVAYYLPSSVFVLVHLYLLIPIWTGASSSFLATGPANLPFIADSGLASLIWTLLLPLAVGIILAGLNSVQIRLFEGRVWWLKWALLVPLTIRNRRLCKQRYGELMKLQKEYWQANTALLDAQSDEEENRIKQHMEEITLDIKEQHEAIEAKRRHQTLPHDLNRVAPTSFGNAYAISEEYAYERYGIDSVLFWPRLRELMHESAPHHSARIIQQKTSLDLSLNFAFICGLLALEATFTARFGLPGHDILLLSLVLINGVLALGFYSASVSAVQALGELIKISFDYHRSLVLKAFNLETPDELIEEQAVWIRLATFIQRGNDFYFTDAREISNKSKKTDEKQDVVKKDEDLASSFKAFLRALFHSIRAYFS